MSRVERALSIPTASVILSGRPRRANRSIRARKHRSDGPCSRARSSACARASGRARAWGITSCIYSHKEGDLDKSHH
jgi:hypothetical protein